MLDQREIFDIPYEYYDAGGSVIHMFLSPVTVCLAVSVYREIRILKKYAIGTSKALELGEVEGAVSSLAIGICGIATVLFAALI